MELFPAWNPGLDKWKTGIEQQRTLFYASRSCVGCKLQVQLLWVPYHDRLLSRIILLLLSSFHQSISWQQQEKKIRSVPHALLVPLVLTIPLFNCQTLLPIACFMRFYINIPNFLKAFRFLLPRAFVFSNILVTWIVSLSCCSVLLQGVGMTLAMGERHLSLPYSISLGLPPEMLTTLGSLLLKGSAVLVASTWPFPP